jgi:tryptophan synthase alpha chain
VIQRSSTRALASGSDLAGALAAVSEFRRRFAVPVILFTYYNPIFIYGVGRLVKDALAAGADGALVVDLPPEESGDISDAVRNKDFHLIRLVAPTTTAERMETIARGASGFLYLVSMTGVTGTRALEPAEVTDYLAQLRRVSALPLCVGFGINRPDQVRALSSVADGIVVGSAFERIIEERLGRNDIADGVRTFTRSLKDATRR